MHSDSNQAYSFCSIYCYGSLGFQVDTFMRKKLFRETGSESFTSQNKLQSFFSYDIIMYM